MTLGAVVTKADTISITVGAPTDPCYNTADVLIDPAGPFAEDAGSTNFDCKSHLGGVWSGSADASGNFDPSQGQGTYEVIYTYDFGGGCEKADTLYIQVTPGLCTPSNLALGQPAEQSSTRGNGIASIAVDGDTEGTGNNWVANPKITHTQSENQPWWQVDLGRRSRYRANKYLQQDQLLSGPLEGLSSAGLFSAFWKCFFE